VDFYTNYPGRRPFEKLDRPFQNVPFESFNVDLHEIDPLLGKLELVEPDRRNFAGRLREHRHDTVAFV
jgi:hypothetical protein